MKGAEKIEIISVSELKPYERNARTHDENQIKKIAASISEFGFTNPILVDEDGVIIAGHGRLAAAQLLGLDEVPVVRLPYLDERQRRALVIADNAIALQSGWDTDILRGELEALRLDGFDLDLVGFSDDELRAITVDGEDGEVVDERKPKTTTDFKYQEQFGVIVICTTEEEQESVYNKMVSEGYNVRVVKT